ncbi:hypothetical protein WJX72_001793 [[Myrmecia] bisecta]|uniref:Uncharacterized protein n=1 Tax=[Myrmecia] bisecta TaxID=41462 RepID=A0AAW1Q532_9CHLO
MRCSASVTSNLGAKILLVGESNAFFTMYKVITAAGLHAYQLDRSGQLKASGLQPDAINQAVTNVLAAADCLLVTYDHLSVASFPWHSFSVIVDHKASLLKSRRSLYEAVLQLERQGAVVVERELDGLDLVLTCDTFLRVWTESSLMGAELASALKERVGQQLLCASSAYATAILCFEGSHAFSFQLAACIEEVYGAARQAGMRVQVFTSTSPTVTQNIVTKAVQTIVRGLHSSNALPVQLAEQQTPHERFLNAFPCLNPLSAARLLSVNCTLAQLVTLSSEGQQQLADALPDIPARSLKLLFELLAWGLPIRGVPAERYVAANMAHDGHYGFAGQAEDGVDEFGVHLEPYLDSQGDGSLDIQMDADEPYRGIPQSGSRFGLDCIIPDDRVQTDPSAQIMDPRNILDDFMQKRRTQGNQGTFKRGKLIPATGTAMHAGNEPFDPPVPASKGSRKSDFLSGLRASKTLGYKRPAAGTKQCKLVWGQGDGNLAGSRAETPRGHRLTPAKRPAVRPWM